MEKCTQLCFSSFKENQQNVMICHDRFDITSYKTTKQPIRARDIRIRLNKSFCNFSKMSMIKGVSNVIFFFFFKYGK